MELLVPALERGAMSSPDKHSRVVHTSASAVYLGPNIDFDTIYPGPARDKKSKYDLYSQSKAGNCTVAREAARRYADKNIVVTSVNPGNIRTELTRYTTSTELWLIVSPCLETFLLSSMLTLHQRGRFSILRRSAHFRSCMLGHPQIPWTRVARYAVANVVWWGVCPDERSFSSSCLGLVKAACQLV
jgi:NAD(P)-dependent dehydrogenase (short-subunit alcohol dehydrogenase family)